MDHPRGRLGKCNISWITLVTTVFPIDVLCANIHWVDNWLLRKPFLGYIDDVIFFNLFHVKLFARGQLNDSRHIYFFLHPITSLQNCVVHKSLLSNSYVVINVYIPILSWIFVVTCVRQVFNEICARYIPRYVSVYIDNVIHFVCKTTMVQINYKRLVQFQWKLFRSCNCDYMRLKLKHNIFA